MNLSTIEQGEELLKKLNNDQTKLNQAQLKYWLFNHASELLQMAREVQKGKVSNEMTVEDLKDY